MYFEAASAVLKTPCFSHLRIVLDLLELLDELLAYRLPVLDDAPQDALHS